jgi:hypothetical protein
MSRMSLEHLGRNQYFAAAFAPYADRGCRAGRVAVEYRKWKKITKQARNNRRRRP